MSASSSTPPPHRISILMSPVGRFLQCRDCQLSYTFAGRHTDRRFVIVRYEGKVPAMASCARCQRKFFTPTTLARDAVGAEEYLGSKFDAHCPQKSKRGTSRLF